jgi:DNA repair protein RadC
MIYYFNEEEEQYLSSPTRKHLISLVGEAATKRLYEAFGNSNSIIRAGITEYRNAKLTENQIERLIAAKELSMEPESQVRSSLDAFYHLSFLQHKQTEYFYVLALSRANRVMKKIEISHGGTSGTIVDVKALYQKVIVVTGVNGIILSHNHPSGNLSPSNPDLDVTKKIIEAGKLLDIKVLDHLIIGNNGKYLSFADEGYM